MLKMKLLIKKRIRRLVVACSMQNRYLYREIQNTADMLSQLAPLMHTSDATHGCLALMNQCLEVMSNSDDLSITFHSCQYVIPSTISSGSRGRPQYDVSIQAIEYFIANGFKVHNIASFLKVSERTVWRRMQQYGIKVSDQYADISDENLRREVEDILNMFPSIGYRSVKAHLQSRGIRVQEDRVRRANHEVDPHHGVLFRRL